MVRTQIQLTEKQYRQLKIWAGRLQISLAEAVRRCVDDRLSAEKSPGARRSLIDSALAVLGRYEDPEGVPNVAADHDRHLSEAHR